MAMCPATTSARVCRKKEVAYVRICAPVLVCSKPCHQYRNYLPWWSPRECRPSTVREIEDATS